MTQLLALLAQFLAVSSTTSEIDQSSTNSIAQQALELANIALANSQAALAAIPATRSSGADFVDCWRQHFEHRIWGSNAGHKLHGFRNVVWGKRGSCEYANLRIPCGGRLANGQRVHPPAGQRSGQFQVRVASRSTLLTWAPNASSSVTHLDRSNGFGLRRSRQRAIRKQLCIQAIDLSVDDLMKRLDSEGMMYDWYMPVYQQCFSLPQDCREARQIILNGVPLRQRDSFYQGKIWNGCMYGGGCMVDECQDLGDFYIPQPLPQRLQRIALVALNNADAGAVCTIEMVDEYGQKQREELTLLPDAAPVVSATQVTDVTYFRKPKTFGPVSLQLHYDDGQRFFVCEYLPHTQEGLFRRKRIPACFQGCNIARWWQAAV
jgi:hypothetical protein